MPSPAPPSALRKALRSGCLCAQDRSLSLVRSLGCKSGLVFNPSTSLDILQYVMDKVDIILLMSVNPGFGGQAFIPATLDKARQARKLIDESGYDITLEIDGGVGVANIKCVRARLTPFSRVLLTFRGALQTRVLSRSLCI